MSDAEVAAEEADYAVRLADAYLARDLARDALVQEATAPSTSTKPLPPSRAATQEDLIRALQAAENRLLRRAVEWRRFREAHPRMRVVPD